MKQRSSMWKVGLMACALGGMMLAQSAFAQKKSDSQNPRESKTPRRTDVRKQREVGANPQFSKLGTNINSVSTEKPAFQRAGTELATPAPLTIDQIRAMPTNVKSYKGTRPPHYRGSPLRWQDPKDIEEVTPGPEGDCCSPNGSPGCNDKVCNACICSLDSFCCDTEWDGICADAAAAGCVVCGGTDVCACGNGVLDDGEACDLSTGNDDCAAGFVCTGSCTCAEIVDCGDATPENEPDCGLPTDTVNGGCNSAGLTFGSISCDETICASGAFDSGAGSRDTDWFAYTVTENTSATFCVTAGFNSLLGAVGDGGGNLINVDDFGGSDADACNAAFAILGDNIFGTPDVEVCNTYTLTPGTYWFFVAATFDFDVPCPGDYTATLTCEAIVPGCGNGIIDEGEDCDGADLGDCANGCEPDCTCSPCVADAQISAPVVGFAGNSCQGDTCIGNAGEDQILEVDIPTAGVWNISTCNQASYDTFLDVGTTCCGNDLASLDDTAGCADFSTSVCVQIDAPGTIWIAMEGFGEDCGDYLLDITTGVCGDGVLDPCEQCDDGNTTPGDGCDENCQIEVPGCGDEGTGDCCEANGTPNCDNADCCNLVCAADSFCCDVSWDGACAGAANATCESCMLCGNGVLDEGEDCDLSTGADDCPAGQECDDSCTCTTPVLCPPGGVEEGEANCGLPEDTINGGCNSAGLVFGSIACDETICASGAFDGFRDTDWYSHTVAVNTSATFCVNGEFNSLLGAVGDGGGNLINVDDFGGDVATACGAAFAILGDNIFGAPNVETCNTYILGPGTYWFFVAPTFDEVIGCPSDYTASLTCVEIEPGCGNGIIDPGEDCDGDDLGACGNGCELDCTCSPCVSDLQVTAPTDVVSNSCQGDTCINNPGEDEIIEVDIPTAGLWQFSTCNQASYDTFLDIGTACCGTDLASLDDTAGCADFSTSVCLDLQPGTVWVAMEGFTDDCGDYTLSILEVVCGDGIVALPCEQCDDGNTEDGDGCDSNCNIEIPGCGDDTAGDCLVPNGSPACSDELCCNTICALDSFCCDVEWDGICADAALGTPECLEPPIVGACCDQNSGVCTDGVTEEACLNVGGASCDPTSRNYVGNGFAIPDNDPAGASSVINVPDAGVITDVNIGLDLTHTWTGDLCVSLTSPAGTTVELIQRHGENTGECHSGAPFGCDEDNWNLTLDDQGTGGSINDACATNLSGCFTPDPGALSAFNDEDKAGDWTLAISDNGGGDTGSLNSWNLGVTNEGEDPGGGGGPDPQWFEGQLCADIACGVQGACCDPDTGTCTDNVSEQACLNPPTAGCGQPTRVYAGAGFSIPDNDPAGASGVINVPDTGIISDLNVGLDVTHTWTGDLCVSVTSPGGTTVTLVERQDAATGECHSGAPFGCDQDNWSLTVDDEGADGDMQTACEEGLSGCFTPNPGPLSAFDGEDKAGDWTLTVSDNGGGDTGSVDAWSLEMVNEGDPTPGEPEWTEETLCADISCGQECGNGILEDPEECDGGACCVPAGQPNECTFSSGECAAGNDAACTAAAICPGDSADCPANPPAAEGTLCNAGTGTGCLEDSFCDGTSTGCPPNQPITGCIDGDGCCAPGCNQTEDSDCVPICGNGRVEDGEECDDGNNANEDGCDENCILEPPAVPTVTQWGMAALVMLLLASIAAKFSRRRVTAR